MNAIEWITFISFWILLPVIAIVATVFLVFWVRSILHRHKDRLNGIDQKLKRIADKIDYHNNSHRQLAEMVNRLIINFDESIISEKNNKIIVEEINHFRKGLTQAVQTINIYSQNIRADIQKVDHDIQGLREILATINPANSDSDARLPDFDLTIKKSPSLEPSISEEERKLIKEFNSILADMEQEQFFRQRYKWITPASSNRDGIIEYTMAADNENLWILPRSGNNDTVLLPSRYLLTNPTLLTSKGEIASRLIGSCFEIIMRDDIERAQLMRFADVEILDRNASGQILKARIRKKGLLELPTGKR